MVETSSGLPGNLWLPSELFGKFEKMCGKVHLAFGTILENLWKALQSGRKSSENCKKRGYKYVIGMFI